MDFFLKTQDVLQELNKTETELFEYVIKNMQTVKDMSIQRFARERFLSSSTIFRFVQKLGFSGYTEFINSLLVTVHQQDISQMPEAIQKSDYRAEYLDNLMETVRVIAPKRIAEIVAVLKQKPNIYILTDNNSHTIGQYYERMLIGLGFRTYFPEVAYHRQHLVHHIGSDDLLIALSYSGKEPELISFVEEVFLKAKPYLLSVTGAENNLLQNLSDTNFYVFADKIEINGMDLTSGVPMLMILEQLVYAYLGER